MRNQTKERIAKAAAVGVVGAAFDTLAVTLSLHRSQTHNALTLSKPLETASKLVIWGSGTSASEWISIHRRHHNFADNELDPHSPVQHGQWGIYKLWFINTPAYAREAKRIRRERDYAPGIEESYLDRHKRAGLVASMAGHMIANKLIGNPARDGLISWLVEKSVYVTAGNTVNALGHSGAKPGSALLTGQITPHEDGSYGSDSAAVALLTMGEGRQQSHHDHPERVFFGDNPEGMSLFRRLAHDTGGAIALGLINHGLATVEALPPHQLQEL